MNAMWRDSNSVLTTYPPLQWYLCGNTFHFLGRDIGGGGDDKASALGACGRAVSHQKPLDQIQLLF